MPEYWIRETEIGEDGFRKNSRLWPSVYRTPTPDNALNWAIEDFESGGRTAVFKPRIAYRHVRLEVLGTNNVCGEALVSYDFEWRAKTWREDLRL